MAFDVTVLGTPANDPADVVEAGVWLASPPLLEDEGGQVERVRTTVQMEPAVEVPSLLADGGALLEGLEQVPGRLNGNGRVPARTSIWLIDDDGDHVAALLRQVDVETPIWSHALDLSSSGALWRLWALIRTAGGLGGYVVRSKLLAAKRPHAVPIYDQHVAAALGAPASAYWAYWYDRLSGADGLRLREAAEEVAAAADRSDLSVLRALDVVIWMRQHGWKDMPGLLGDFARPIGT